MSPAESNLILPDERLVDPDGRPVTVDGPSLVGIDLYEAEGGHDSLALIATIKKLRETHEKVATLVAAPGAVTAAVITEVRLFNQEMYLGRELTELEEAVIRSSVKSQLAKAERRAANHQKSIEGQRRGAVQQANGELTRSARRKQLKKQGKKKRRLQARRAARKAAAEVVITIKEKK